MAGIYLHIPFCKQACHYCDFHFSTSTKNQDKVVDAMEKEIELRQDYLQDKSIETIYFGGGTPSLLSKSQLEKLLLKIHSVYDVEQDVEITLEVNPDDLNAEKLFELKQAGINRLSIGIQSFFNRDLTFMNRSHNVSQAIECVKNAQKVGFDNITIDLIYGIPNQTNEEWERNLLQAINLNVQHISSYCLTVEPKTALAHMVKKKQVIQVTDEVAEQQFNMLVQVLGDNGLEQYEISNFAKEGFISQHNSNYWRGVKYIGVGPSAHSFDGHSRQWNVANNNLYLKALENDKLDFEKEILTENQRYNEYILTSLRTKWGTNENFIFNNFDQKMTNFFKKESKKQQKEGFLLKNDENYVLSAKGKFLADRLASDLFYL
ncbi:MAG: radical SAM family heme chaperone HemW [Flavobacteriales bacterium]|nr:radical SAM family heme chaperone HemW [Flavobacteriales bacterium]